MSICNSKMPSLLFVPANKISVDNNFPGFGAVKVKEKGVKLIRFGVHCSADSRFNTTDSAVQNKVPALPNWQKIPEPHKMGEDDKVSKCIKSIQEMFRSMDDGVTSISAYDTAWVALVEDMEKTKVPMFPSSLEWIADNQLSDGSWGDDKFFLAHDRILNTLACVIALKTWNVHPQKMERGLLFVRENTSKLSDVKIEHTTMGFEIVFPSLVQVAESLNIEIPKNLPIMKEIFAQGDLKRSRYS